MEKSASSPLLHNWADEMEQAVFQSNAKDMWSEFKTNQIRTLSTRLEFTEPMRVGDQVSYTFDKKLVVLRPWSIDMDTAQMVKSVPVWIRLNGLGLQYWARNNLSALVSTIGKPIKMDKFTKEKMMIKFARILVDIEISDNPPKTISFINEKKQMVEQSLEYEWLPSKCMACSMLDHTDANCNKEKGIMEMDMGKQLKLNQIMDSVSLMGWNIRGFNKKEKQHVLLELLDVFLKTVAMNKWDAISDHSYCIIKHVEAGNLGTIPFRFCNYWMDREGYNEVVLSCWNNQSSSKGLKANLNNHSFHVTEKSTQQAYNSAKQDYSSYMQQHAKINWMKFGDENLSFFHASLEKRRQENKLLFYCRNEEVIEDYPKVAEHFLNHFKNFMGKGSSATRRLDQTILTQGKILDIQEQVRLIRPFTKAEVKRAMFDIHSSKSPGPDGYGSGFFKGL
uniref:DUF4283 domain-containing protein n=1 Tax=Cannabis sativa TaxID=3483 RepID=A0A803PLB4_CANSA